MGRPFYTTVKIRPNLPTKNNSTYSFAPNFDQNIVFCQFFDLLLTLCCLPIHYWYFVCLPWHSFLFFFVSRIFNELVLGHFVNLPFCRIVIFSLSLRLDQGFHDVGMRRCPTWVGFCLTKHKIRPRCLKLARDEHSSLFCRSI